MNLLCCFLYLLLMTGLGYLLISLIHASSRLTVVELLGLVPALGAGSLGLLLFWLSLCGLAPSRLLLSIIGAVTVAGLVLLTKFHRLARLDISRAPPKNDGWSLVPGLAIMTVILLVVAGSLAVPVLDWDAFAIWGLKAKVLAHEALRPTPAYFHDLTLSYSHLDYPLMLPFLTAGGYAAMGIVDDQAGKLVSIFLGVLIVPLVYLGLGWKLSRLPAMCLCAILALLPTFSRLGGVGCADLPMTTFYTGSILYLARWIDRQQRADLVLAVLFSVFTAFTKNEGLVLAFSNGLVLIVFAVFRRPGRCWLGAAVFWAGLLAVDAAWLVWSHDLPRSYEDYGSKLLSIQSLAKLPNLMQIFTAMWLQITDSGLWGWLWLMTGLLAALGWRAFQQPSVLALWLLLGLQLLAYALVYSITPWNLRLLLASSLERLLWHAVPAVILLAGWHWSEIMTPAVGVSVTEVQPEPAAAGP